MKCFNCYSEFLPTLVMPLCQECGFCYFCRDFLACFHYELNKDHKHKQKQNQLSSIKKKNIQKWDSYNDIVPRLPIATPEDSAAVIVIDESARRRLGKLHILDLIQNLTGPEMNCYVDIIPTGTSDDDVIKVFKSYANIPAFILTSDKDLYMKLLGRSVFVKTNRSGVIGIVARAIKHRISRS
ncbi:MAG TPA: hypothetical protein VFI73_14260 [Candidatus Nitrosopolaris sp.]|nr:hypothetical protein [Candidatus Nitrosopolaris sp.]